jgi:TolB-like protein
VTTSGGIASVPHSPDTRRRDLDLCSNPVVIVSGSGAMNFFTELKRRKVLKVGAAYLVIAWLAVQAASIGLPAFEAPTWALRAFILVLMLCFPIAVVMAWVLEVTPEGVRVDSASAGYRLVPSAKTSKSIAVLPFDDLSPGHDQEYFSDGVAEEILNALVRVKDLKVVGRTSSFYFRGRNEELRKIGETLGVHHVLAGSVRTQQNRVRITAQLLRTDTGLQTWSHTYDGEIGDVFELQERIARAIAGKLDAALYGEQRQRLVPVATVVPEAYVLYLQASAIFNRRDGKGSAEAIAQLEQALKLDAHFARAHARLAALYTVMADYGTMDSVRANAAAEHHAKQAIALDDGIGEPYAVLGHVYRQQRRYVEERDAFELALAAEPEDANTNYWYAMALIFTGYRKRGIEALDRVLEIDPILPIALLWRGSTHASDGRIEEAEMMLKRASAFGLVPIGFGMSMVADARGDKAGAIAHLAVGFRVFMPKFPESTADVLASACFGDDAARTRAHALIDDYLTSRPAVIAAVVPYTLLRMGDSARALNLIQSAPTSNDGLIFGFIFNRLGRNARAQPEFAELVHRTGLEELWRLNGPPDFARAA